MAFEYKPFIIKIPVTYILSENKRLGGGRRKHLSEEASNYINEIHTALNAADKEHLLDTYFYLNGDYGLKATYHFVVKGSYYRRDTDNMIKMLQDAVFNWIGINDSLIKDIHAYKFVAPSLDNEMVIVKLEPSFFDENSYEEEYKRVLKELPKQ